MRATRHDQRAAITTVQLINSLPLFPQGIPASYIRSTPCLAYCRYVSAFLHALGAIMTPKMRKNRWRLGLRPIPSL